MTPEERDCLYAQQVMEQFIPKGMEYLSYEVIGTKPRQPRVGEELPKELRTEEKLEKYMGEWETPERIKAIKQQLKDWNEGKLR